MSYCIATEYTGPKLSKSKGNYRDWDVEINIYLRLNGLSRFMTEDPIAKSSEKGSSEYRRWSDGDSLTTAIIYNTIDSDERGKLSFEKPAHENLKILKKCHQELGVARQIGHLQAAFSSRFDAGISLTQTAKKIRGDIKNAFACAEFSEDLMTCFCILNSLADEKFAQIRSDIVLQLSSSTKEDPCNYASIFSYLDNKQSVRDSLPLGSLRLRPRLRYLDQTSSNLLEL